MKGRKIRVDWDDLESAFNSRLDESGYYLDLVTGHVHLLDEGQSDEEDPATAGPAVTDTRALVTPPDEETEVGWMIEFVESEDDLDDELQAGLREALDDEDDPLDAFRECLRDRDDARSRWFLFRSDRFHELIDRWLEDNGVTLVEPPPWR